MQKLFSRNHCPQSHCPPSSFTGLGMSTAENRFELQVGFSTNQFSFDEYFVLAPLLWQLYKSYTTNCWTLFQSIYRNQALSVRNKELEKNKRIVPRLQLQAVVLLWKPDGNKRNMKLRRTAIFLGVKTVANLRSRIIKKGMDRD